MLAAAPEVTNCVCYRCLASMYSCIEHYLEQIE